VDAQESAGRVEATPYTQLNKNITEEFGSKTMTREITTRDEMKAVERWENEGGRVSPLNNLWASLKSFAREDTLREGQLMDARKSAQHRPGVFFGGLTGGGSK
jgi:hypothetical protein